MATNRAAEFTTTQGLRFYFAFVPQFFIFSIIPVSFRAVVFVAAAVKTAANGVVC